MHLLAILRIVASGTELLCKLADKLTPEQMQALVDRHEERVQWLRGLVDKVKD
jgi:Spy/CpxP family protein refolding chaperone